MSGKEGARIFVGGLSWETTERDLEAAFGRFGKVLDAQIMVERDSGRPRGFGFVTFVDKRAMKISIIEMHNKELGGRQISVKKAEPKLGSDDAVYGYGHEGYSSGGRGGYRGGADDPPPVDRSECFKCGRQGHWARDCLSAGGDGGRFSTRSRIGGGGGPARGDKFGGGDRYSERYIDDRHDGERYIGDRDCLEGSDSRYNGGRGRYTGDRYLLNGYPKERSFDRDGGPRGGGDRHGSGGPARYEGGGGHRERPRPYDRPRRGRALPGAAQPSPDQPSPQVIGAAFVQRYYIVLHQSPDLVHRFYQESSILSRPDSNGVMTSVTTMEAIDNDAFSLVFSNCNVEIESAESQASYKDGILIDVTGSLTGRDNNIRRKFTQSFFLAPQEGGYFVLNDIFRFVDLGQPMEANQVIANANEPDTDDNDEVVNPMENVGSAAGENAVCSDPEINLGHSDHQLISEATASVSQVAELKKSYASIFRNRRRRRSNAEKLRIKAEKVAEEKLGSGLEILKPIELCSYQ